MSINEDEAEIDRILAQADIICESPDLLGAVKPSTNDTTAGREGIAPRREAMAECGSKGNPAMGALLFSLKEPVTKLILMVLTGD